MRAMFSLAVLAVSLSVVSLSDAAERTIEFDVVSVVAAQEAISIEGVQTGPDEKLIAIRLQVSTYVPPQSRREVKDLVITFDNPSPAFQVVDFFPKTTLDSRFAGPVTMQSSLERKLGVEVDATGIYKCLTGVTLGGSLHDARSSSTEFKLAPPKEVVAASGTIQRGRGVYFKLRPSANETIEGAKEFLIVARVPRSWRADLARVRCTASGDVPSTIVPMAESPLIAQCDFLIGLYLDGDVPARRAAERFVASEQWLRRVAAEQQSSIRRSSSPKLIQKIGFASPSIPANWLDQWLYGPASEEPIERLPPQVRKAAAQYATARSQLHHLTK
jgi:hypothetical protein